MFSTTSFPRLTGIVYFSENDTRDVQRDWRIDSSPTSLAGFREGLSTRAKPQLPAPDNQLVNLPAVQGGHGFSNNITRSVQVLLTVRGFPTPTSDTWTSATSRNVTAFQQAKGLPLTGIVDAHTWSRLLYG